MIFSDIFRQYVGRPEPRFHKTDTVSIRSFHPPSHNHHSRNCHDEQHARQHPDNRADEINHSSPFPAAAHSPAITTPNDAPMNKPMNSHNTACKNGVIPTPLSEQKIGRAVYSPAYDFRFVLPVPVFFFLRCPLTGNIIA